MDSYKMMAKLNQFYYASVLMVALTAVGLPAFAEPLGGVPFKSQWDAEKGKGWNNCGPASVAMAMAFYGKDISVEEAAKKMRRVENPYLNTTTNFKLEETKTLLSEHNLMLEDVNSLDTIKDQLKLGRPVIMLVYNDYYVRNDTIPYIRREDFSRHTNKDGTLSLIRHIVVITSYDETNFYINDPLAVKFQNNKVIADPEVGTNFAVPIATFIEAAQPLGWYGAAVTTNDGKLPTEVQTLLDSKYRGYKLAEPAKEDKQICFNKRSGFQPSIVWADFNGDGRRDYAVQIIYGQRVILLAFLNQTTANQKTAYVDYEIHSDPLGERISVLAISRKGDKYFDHEKEIGDIYHFNTVTAVYCKSSAISFIFRNGRFAKVFVSD